MTPFSILCSTEIQFGAGTHRRLLDMVPKGPVLLVKGASNAASAPVRTVLDAAGVPYETVECGSEPSIKSVNVTWQAVQSTRFSALIACGGGSVIDTGKALLVAMHKGAPLTDEDFAKTHTTLGDLPLIVLPTTAGTGSEVTANAVLGAAQSAAKISLRGPGLQPKTAIIDPDMMQSAPKHVVLYSGLDAVVQNIEAYTSAKATPFTRALAGPAVASTLTALKDVITTNSPEAWSRLAWGSVSSGIALANGGLGAVHGLASILGAAVPAPHGALCGRLLVPVMRANLASNLCTSDIRRDIMMCQTAITDLFAPFDAQNPYSGFEAWLGAQNLPRLAEWGVQDDQIMQLAEASVTASSSLKNPVKLTASELAQVLRAAL